MGIRGWSGIFWGRMECDKRGYTGHQHDCGHTHAHTHTYVPVPATIKLSRACPASTTRRVLGIIYIIATHAADLEDVCERELVAKSARLGQRPCVC